jgi:hypothetical protein
MAYDFIGMNDDDTAGANELQQKVCVLTLRYRTLLHAVSQKMRLLEDAKREVPESNQREHTHNQTAREAEFQTHASLEDVVEKDICYSQQMETATATCHRERSRSLSNLVICTGQTITQVIPGVLSNLPSDCQVVNARGGSMIPAFTDCHMHLSGAVRSSLAVDLSNTTSLADAISFLVVRSKQCQLDEWVISADMNEDLWSAMILM